MTLRFSCKDPVITHFCDTRFRRQFERDLDRAQSRDGMEEIQRVWQRRLTKEARRQEWYDYTEVDGVRRVIYAGGVPSLLIPEVVID